MIIYTFLIISILSNLIFAWTPIGSIHNLNHINSVKIANKEYVVWKPNSKEFVVQDDICPHRLAPLSEGRIDNGNIQCGYHGWEFNCQGLCEKIPQSDNEKTFLSSFKLKTYPIKISGDILWAKIDSNLNKFNEK